jgi:transposase
VTRFSEALLAQAYPDDAACLGLIWRLRYGNEDWKAGCPACATARRFTPVEGRRSFACSVCRHQLYPTSGTAFQGSRLPLIVWFTAVHALGSRNLDIKAVELRSLLGGRYSYKTVRRVMQRVRDDLSSGEKRFGGDAAAALRPDVHAESYSREAFTADLGRLLPHEPV